MLPTAALVAFAVALVSTSGTAHASTPLFHASSGLNPRLHNSQTVNLWKLHQAARAVESVSSNTALASSLHSSSGDSGLKVQDGTEGSGYTGYGDVQVAVGKRATTFPQYNFTQPLDHFYGTTNATFPQRYWVRSFYSCGCW